ncbi:hypothetical protein BGZ94_004909 [Podila epigama]|nr:hypothetical protein BGZ94_004909 [Podila epigama]
MPLQPLQTLPQSSSSQQLPKSTGSSCCRLPKGIFVKRDVCSTLSLQHTPDRSRSRNEQKDSVVIDDGKDNGQEDDTLADFGIDVDPALEMSNFEASVFYAQEINRLNNLTAPRAATPRPWVTVAIARNQIRRLMESASERKERKRLFVEEMTRAYTFGPASHRDVQKEYREIDFEKRERQLDRAWAKEQERIYMESERMRILQLQLDWMRRRHLAIEELKRRQKQRAMSAIESHDLTTVGVKQEEPSQKRMKMDNASTN